MWDETGTSGLYTCRLVSQNMAKRTTARSKHHHEESSESENETEPAKIFHRKLSTNAKSAVSSTIRIEQASIYQLDIAQLTH